MYGTHGARYGFFPHGFIQEWASQEVERAAPTHYGSDSTRDSPTPSEEQFQLKTSSDSTVDSMGPGVSSDSTVDSMGPGVLTSAGLHWIAHADFL